MSYLIVDDEDYIRDILAEIFEMKSKNYFEASTGKKAIEVVSNHDIEIAFIDYSLDDMNGFELAEKIKELNDSIDLYLLTGWRESDLNKKKLKYFKDIIEKPFDVADIMKIL